MSVANRAITEFETDTCVVKRLRQLVTPLNRITLVSLLKNRFDLRLANSNSVRLTGLPENGEKLVLIKL